MSNTSQLVDVFRIYIADGFSEDCEDLIQRCLKLEVLNFQTFCTVWKEMHFPSLYQELSSCAEIAELSEELIIVAKSFMVQDTGNYKESVISLFIVYALVTQQPFANFAYLPICPEDVPEIKRLEGSIRRHRFNDALLILGRVLVKHSRYTAVERERGFDIALIKYFNGSVVMKNKNMGSTGIFGDQNEEPDMLMELGTIARRYTQCRDRLNDNIKAGLKYVNPSLPSQLSTSFKRLVKGYYDNDEAKDRSDTVTEIKQRAMTNAPDQLHHLMTSQKRNENPLSKTNANKSPQKTSAPISINKAISSASFFSRMHNSKVTKFGKKSTVMLNELENEELSLQRDRSLEEIDGYAIDTETRKDNTKERNRKRKNKKINEVPNKVHKGTKTIKNTNPGKAKRKPKGKMSSNEVTNKEIKDVIPAIVHSINGETECEIEVIDYAIDSSIPVHKVISDVIKSAE
ncbi:uncharacterized protein LOC123707528 [Pieris brassicae]|uniref:uncharacterized protein LOC123707528 n=1 Tax=Pieris brassicae TaxID=7116 RepID=UPI001E65F17F|nr:uncharacterized protein LOC123707528 [Pieris brassicae]